MMKRRIMMPKGFSSLFLFSASLSLFVISTSFSQETPALNSNVTFNLTATSSTPTTPADNLTGVDCNQLKCPVDRHCVYNKYNQPTCVCFWICPNDPVPVCGSNNKTYTNDCYLYQESCMSGANITILYRAKCGEENIDGSTTPYSYAKSSAELRPKFYLMLFEVALMIVLATASVSLLI